MTTALKVGKWAVAIGIAAILGFFMAVGQYKERIATIPPRVEALEAACEDAAMERVELRGAIQTLDVKQEARQDELLRRLTRIDSKLDAM